MAESVRKRKSKWDAPAEPHADASAKVNVLSSECFSFSFEQESNHFSVPFEMNKNTEMIKHGGSEADDFTKWPQYEENSAIHMDLSESPKILKHSGMGVGNEDDMVKSYELLSGEQHATAKEDLSRTRNKGDQSLDQSYGADLYSGHESWKQPNYGMGVGNKDDSVKLYESLSGAQHAAAKEDLSRARDKGDQSLSQSYGAVNGQAVWKSLSSGMEEGNKDDSMKLYESFSGEHAAAKENHLSRARDKGGPSLNESYGAGLWKRLSPAASPQRSRGMLDRSRSRSRSRDRSRVRGRGRSRSRSQSRSPSYSYRRGPQRSRSRSPTNGSRRPERWAERGGAGVRVPVPCRDFTVGRCRRGSECKFLHEESRFRHEERSRRQSGRYRDSTAIEIRGSKFERIEIRGERFERERYSGSDSMEQKSRFHDNRPTTICQDFLMGRCHRGSSCRYTHQEAASGGEWSPREETRERSYDLRDTDPSSGDRRLESMPKLPCKFFLEGRCSRGESCRFSHEGAAPLDNRSGSNALVDTTNSSQCMNSEDGFKVEGSNLLAASYIAGYSIGQDVQNQSVVPQPTQAQMFAPNAQMFPLVPPMLLNPQLQQAIYAMRQNLQNQFMVPPPHPNFNGSIQNLPVLPPPHQQNYNLPSVHNGQNEQNYNLIAQMQQNPAVPHHGLNQHNANFTSQILHSMPPLQNGQNENLLPSVDPNGQQMQRAELSKEQSSILVSGNPIMPNFTTQILHSLPPLQNGQNGNFLQSVNPNGQQMQRAEPLNEQSSVLVSGNQILPNFTSQILHSLPPLQNGQNENLLQSVNPNEQQIQRTEPSSEQSSVLLSGNPLMPDITSQILHTLPPLQNGPNENLLQSVNPNEQQMERPEPSNEQSSVVVSANPIMPKIVTSEQAAQITNLSASLAQFFSNASTLIPFLDTETMPAVHSLSNNTEPVKQDVDSVPPGFEQKDNNPAESNPPPKSVDAEEKVQPVGETNGPKEDHNSEADQDKKEPTEADGENKQGKDTKAMKMFKSALVEFAKDVLKPSWKEGHLSKEAHKTIVKKVVEKVTGAIQGPNIPQTPDKIDIYLSHSKAKLTKLVQGYVEKYVKS